VLLRAGIKLSFVNLDLAALPTDTDALHRLVRELATQAAGDRTELVQARAEVERLRLIIQRLQRAQFGRQSERLDADQLALGLEDLDADIARARLLWPPRSTRLTVNLLRGASLFLTIWRAWT
jgi:transposase